MGDLIYVAIVVGFFAICVAYVRACDAIVGPDGDLSRHPEPATAPDDATAPDAADAAEPAIGARP